MVSQSRFCPQLTEASLLCDFPKKFFIAFFPFPPFSFWGVGYAAVDSPILLSFLAWMDAFTEGFFSQGPVRVLYLSS